MRLFTRLSLSCALLTGISAAASAQITLGSSWLLDAGYSADMRVDENYTDPQGNLGKSGGNQRWEFRDLQADDRFDIEVRNASEGPFADSFPTANLLMRTGRDIGLAGTETDLYLRRTSQRIEVIGLSDTSSIVPVVRLPQPLDLFRVPLTSGSSGTDNFQFRLAFGKEFLLILGIDSSQLALVDSVGFSLRQTVAFQVDGWGEIITPRVSAPALRVRTVTESSQDLEVKVPFFGWVPISQFIQVPDSVFQNGAGRSVDYSWLIADESYPLVSLFVNNDNQPTELTYNARIASGLVEYSPKAKLAVRAEAELLTIESLLDDLGTGHVEVYGPDGRTVFSSSMLLQGGQLQTSTAHWPTGLYLVTLWQDGRLLGTQRVMTTR